MYEIYRKQIYDMRVGTGTDSLIVRDGVIVAYDRSWDDSWATPARQAVRSRLIGQPASQRGPGWRKVTGFDAENAQGWADDAVWMAGGAL